MINCKLQYVKQWLKNISLDRTDTVYGKDTVCPMIFSLYILQHVTTFDAQQACLKCNINEMSQRYLWSTPKLSPSPMSLFPSSFALSPSLSLGCVSRCLSLFLVLHFWSDNLISWLSINAWLIRGNCVIRSLALI